MWEKRYTHTLLVGLQIGATILDISMEMPQKTWNGTTTCPSYPMQRHVWVTLRWRLALSQEVVHN